MRIFLLSVYFYLSNFLFSLPNKFLFSFSLFYVITLMLIALFFATFNNRKILLAIWLFLYFCDYSYLSFSGSLATQTDITLFFSHFLETFESFFGVLHLMFFPFIFLVVGAILIYFIDATQTKSKKIFLLLIIISYFIPYSINDSSFKLTKEIILSFFSNNNKIINTNIVQKPKYLPKKEQIIIIIGESGRYKNLSIFGYQRPTTPNIEKIKDKLEYKIIYANARNTYVSLPLFFFGANEPQTIYI